MTTRHGRPARRQPPAAPAARAARMEGKRWLMMAVNSPGGWCWHGWWEKPGRCGVVCLWLGRVNLPSNDSPPPLHTSLLLLILHGERLIHLFLFARSSIFFFLRCGAGDLHDAHELRYGTTFRYLLYSCLSLVDRTFAPFLAALGGGDMIGLIEVYIQYNKLWVTYTFVFTSSKYLVGIRFENCLPPPHVFDLCSV